MAEDTKLGAMRKELIALYMSYEPSINQASSYKTVLELIKRRSLEEEKIVERYGQHVNRTLDKGPLWKDAEKAWRDDLVMCRQCGCQTNSQPHCEFCGEQP